LQAAVTEMRADVRTVPVRLDAVDRWIQAHETRSNTSENRLSTIERSMAALQAEMDLLNNVANGPLGPRGRTRRGRCCLASYWRRARTLRRPPPPYRPNPCPLSCPPICGHARPPCRSRRSRRSRARYRR
jgi:hypothetical protein